MTDHAWLDAAAPYALGAQSAEERAAFEAHLADCAICGAEVQALREVSGLLAHAAAAATPAPALRERILREARAVRPLAARGRSLRPWIAAAASLALAVAAGLGYWRASHARDALTRALAAARDTIAVRDSLVVTLLAPDVGTAALAATGKPPSARLFWSPSRHRVVMAVFNLAPAPTGRIYQLWAIAAGKPMSLGLFNTAPDGRATVAMDVARELASFQLTAVTEEPVGGSPQPTQQPFLVGKLSGGE